MHLSGDMARKRPGRAFAKATGLALAAASTLAFAQPANAVTFTITGGGSTFSFDIADTPTPDSWFNGVSFVVYDVAAPSVSGLVDVTLYNNDWFDTDLRALQIEDYQENDQLFELFGAQLYTGPESSPTFTPGSYRLSDARGNFYDVTIGSGVSPVPEASTWAMMVGGFAVIGLAHRRRQRVRVRFV